MEFRFLPEFIRDLDIIDKELLFNLLDLFIKNNKIPPTSFIIVIADSASIIKDFLSPSTQNIDEFLEHIPFEDISSKKILIPNGIRVYATNKDLYETIKEFLIRVGSEIIYILPGTIIGPELHPSLDTNGINAILKKYQTLKEYNLATQPVLQLTTGKKENHEEKETEAETPNIEINEKKSDKKRTIILVAVFAILLIVLIIVYLTQPSPF
jgi:hypothetical protein